MKSITTICLLLLCNTTLAQQSYPRSGSPTINVDWGKKRSIEIGTDFTINYSDPQFPEVELKTEDLSWQIWSSNELDPNKPGNLGRLIVHDEGNFMVRLNGNGQPGADNIKGIDFDVQGDLTEAWLIDSVIACSVDGDILGKKSPKLFASEIELIVPGDVDGDIFWHSIKQLHVEGTLKGNVSINLIERDGTLDLNNISPKTHIHVEIMHVNARLRIGGNVERNAVISVDYQSRPNSIELGYNSGYVKGEVILERPVDSSDITFYGNFSGQLTVREGFFPLNWGMKIIFKKSQSGNIDIFGDTQASVFVGKNSSGKLNIENLNGKIKINKLSGSIHIQNGITSGSIEISKFGKKSRIQVNEIEIQGKPWILK